MKKKKDRTREEEKAFEKVSKTLSLRDGLDNDDTDREAERILADEIVQKLVNKFGLEPIELCLNVYVGKEKAERMKETFGVFYPFVLFFPVWEEYKQVAYQNPCNTLCREQKPSLERKRSRIIQDRSLERKIKRQLGLREYEEINFDDLKRLKILEARRANIKTLEGLEYAINLRYLYLEGNPLKDIKAIESLGNLKELDLSNTKVDNINVLSDLLLLEAVFLSGLDIDSLKPVLTSKLLEFVDFCRSKAQDQQEVIKKLIEKKVFVKE